MPKKSPSFENLLSTAITAESLGFSPRIQAAWVQWVESYVDQSWRDRETDRLFPVRTVLKKLWERNHALAPDRILGTIGGSVFALRRGSWLQENEWRIEQMSKDWRKAKKNFSYVKDGLSPPSAPPSVPHDFDWRIEHARDDLELYSKHNFHTPGAVARWTVFFLIKTFTMVKTGPRYRDAALLAAVAFPEWKSSKSKSVKKIEDAAKKIWRSHKSPNKVARKLYTGSKVNGR